MRFLSLNKGLSDALVSTEKLLWLLFLATLPFQTRLIVYQSDWMFNEWRSLTLYATDLLMIGLFLFWGLSWFEGRVRRASELHQAEYFLFAFAFVAMFSLVNAIDRRIGLFQLIKLGEFMLFYFYVSRYAFGRFSLAPSLRAFVGGGVAQAGIAVLQFVRQSSIGLKYLGESVLDPSLSGVASFFITGGEKIIRAYGTFPHPNVLSAYLLTVMGVVLWMYVMKQGTRKENFPPYAALYAVVMSGFFFTFSRTAFFAGALGLAALYLFLYRDERYRSVLIRFLVATGVIVGALIFFYWPEMTSRIHLSTGEQAVQLRIFYGKEVLDSRTNLLGVGMGNFVEWLMRQAPGQARYVYQPAHNIFLVIYKETGILGVALFIIFLVELLWRCAAARHWREAKVFMITLLGIFLFLASFDHFFWTLQQGRILWWGILGLVAALQRFPNHGIA